MDVDMLNTNAAAPLQESFDYARKPETAGASAQSSVKKTQNAAKIPSNEGNSYALNSNGAKDVQDEDSSKISQKKADAEKKAGLEVLEKAIDEANKKIMGYNRQFEYRVHEVTKDIMIKIINSETHEVMKEIPPEKTLDAVAKMWELTGLLVDEKR